MNLNLEKSLKTQEHAKSRIPGMTQLLSKRPDFFALGVWPGYYQKAKGVEVWDLDGNRYIDMSISGIGANILGYADPDVDQAVKEAIDQGSSCSLNSWEEVELADLLCELHPWAQKVRFARSGGEAMTIAVRIARAYTNRDIIAFCGYHGWHDWYLAANLGTKNALGEHLISGLEPRGVPRQLAGTSYPFRFNHLEELEKIVSENKSNLAAIIMEPQRGQEPTSEFIEGIQQLAKETGAVWVIDEISAGFRMNTGGLHLKLNMEPDIAVFSKAMGNGYPIAAIIGKENVMQAAQSTFISSTMWTERIGFVAALATIQKHRKYDAGKHLTLIGEKVQEGWKEAAQETGLIIHVGGIPPMSHFAFQHEKATSIKSLFIQLMLEDGFLASTIFDSMYAHQTEHFTAYIQAVKKSFATIANCLKNDNLEQHMKGASASVGFRRLT